MNFGGSCPESSWDSPNQWAGPRHNSEQRIRSAKAVIRMLLAMGDDVDKPLKRRFLSNCLWHITQASGRNKYQMRYRSRGARDIRERSALRHDHVYRRKEMVQKLIDSPDQIDQILKRAIACIVTKDEHELLNHIDQKHSGEDGWQRYELAGIEVIDMLSGQAVPYNCLPQ